MSDREKIARICAEKRNARRVRDGDEDIGVLPLDLEQADAILDALTDMGWSKNEWRPIESAPKDGSTFLAVWPTGNALRNRIYTTNWTGWGGGCWEGDTIGRPIEGPKLWQPLPPAPTREGE